MHKRDPLRDTVYALVRIRGHFVPRREPRTYSCFGALVARAFARASLPLELTHAHTHTHTRAARVHVSRRSIRLINSFICPPSGTLACARRALAGITVWRDRWCRAKRVRIARDSSLISSILRGERLSSPLRVQCRRRMFVQTENKPAREQVSRSCGYLLDIAIDRSHVSSGCTIATLKLVKDEARSTINSHRIAGRGWSECN